MYDIVLGYSVGVGKSEAKPLRGLAAPEAVCVPGNQSPVLISTFTTPHSPWPFLFATLSLSYQQPQVGKYKVPNTALEYK